MINRQPAAAYSNFENIYQEKLRLGQLSWRSGQAEREIIPCFLDELLAVATLKNGASILEVGCGAGDLSFYLVQQGYHVTGIDVAPTAIVMAKTRAVGNNASVNFLVCSVLDARNLQAEAFDCVLDGLCLHCIVGIDRNAFFRNVYCTLKTDGVFLIMTMCGEPRSMPLRSMYDEITRTVCSGPTPELYFGKAMDIITEIQSAGFSIEYTVIKEGNSLSGDQDMMLCVAKKMATPSQ